MWRFIKFDVDKNVLKTKLINHKDYGTKSVNKSGNLSKFYLFIADCGCGYNIGSIISYFTIRDLA
jgi:hypothetical protein